jgi:hypothetical protein
MLENPPLDCMQPGNVQFQGESTLQAEPDRAADFRPKLQEVSTSSSSLFCRLGQLFDRSIGCFNDVLSSIRAISAGEYLGSAFA